MTTPRALSAAALAASLFVATTASAEEHKHLERRDATAIPRNEISTEHCYGGALATGLWLDNREAIINHRLGSRGKPGKELQLVFDAETQKWLHSCDGLEQEKAFYDELVPVSR